MDCGEIEKLTLSFDAILCGFVMPYLSKEDCFNLIKDSHFRLNPNGIIYFSVIEGDYQQSGYETSSDGAHTMYVYYHQEDQLLAVLEENGFECLQFFRKIYPKTEGVDSTHLIFIARKIG